MSPDDGTVATPHERPPLLRGHFHTTFRVADGEGFYCMPLLPPRHLLPHVLQMMSRNLKYDQFDSKGYKYEENLQSMTKMAANPKFDLLH